MKYAFLLSALLWSPLSFASEISPDIQAYLEQATQKKLHQTATWQRLMYVNAEGKSEVSYAGYFLAKRARQTCNLNWSKIYRHCLSQQNPISLYDVNSRHVVSG